MLTFEKSPIWPDNSEIRWEIDGKGYVDDVLKFIIRTNEHSDPFDNSCFVSVLEDIPGVKEFENRDIIEDSPIFWNVIEWSNNKKPMGTIQYYMARQAAMNWAENYIKN